MTSEATAEALSKQLDSIITECRDASNISVTYYTTDLPRQTEGTHKVNLEELMRLFRDFRSKTSSGEIKETPVEVSCTSLKPWESTFPNIYHGRGGLQRPRRFISEKTGYQLLYRAFIDQNRSRKTAALYRTVLVAN